MNIQHHLLRQLFNGSNTMGIPESKLLSGMKILDAGCGSAIWLAEMNRDYPQGEYYGVDIDINPWATTFQTFARQEGRDFTLVRANLNERLPFEDNTFDFVHQQVYASVIYKDRWPLVIAEYCRILKPGGYIDLICLDSTNEFHGTPSKIHLEVNDLFQRLAEPRGADVRIARELGNLVTSNGGFVDIASMKRAAPLGWGGVAGLLWQENARRGMISLTDYACACLDITPEKWNTYITTLNQDLEKVRVVQYVYRVFARKRAVEQ
ncbi:S-adenosyl-L-methionine-dependent methyltransferase [Cladochytrium replicatum]|nr:S-adenosyl-L-methionine-dependent methyltransferase [Cladochytrium replicatum]